MSVKPLLEVGLGPGLVQPVAGIGGGLASLLGRGLVCAARLLEKGVTLAGLWNRNAVVIAERLELALGPGVEDPILDAGPSRLSLVLGLIPSSLDLVEEVVLVRGSGVLGLDALELQVLAELGRVPVLVGRHDVGLPILLHQLLEVFAIGWGGIRDIVVGKPALELILVPFVVSWRGMSVKSMR